MNAVTFRARQRWPQTTDRRRAVVKTRTADGEPCTIIVERDDSGLIVSFHGALRTTAAPSPEELAELIDALRTAGAR